MTEKGKIDTPTHKYVIAHFPGFVQDFQCKCNFHLQHDLRRHFLLLLLLEIVTGSSDIVPEFTVFRLTRWHQIEYHTYYERPTFVTS
jgi:hypothetical protein